MIKLTDKQEQLLRHTLGADKRILKKYWGDINYFLIGNNDSSLNREELEKMEQAGLVTRDKRFGLIAFSATRKGAIAVGFKPYQLRKMEFKKAPYKDFKGKAIYEGDTIVHHYGKEGIVLFNPDRDDDCAEWRVYYEGGLELSLGLQVGDKGQAIVNNLIQLMEQ